MSKFFTGVSTKVGDRSNNEDAFFLATKESTPNAEKLDVRLPFDLVAAVADGMGGGMYGELASAEVVSFLHELFIKGEYFAWTDRYGLTGIELLNIMKEIVKEVNKRVNELASQKNAAKMGTTFDLFIISKGSFHWAHVGDSRIYKINSQVVTQLTTDHDMHTYARANGIPISEVKKNFVTNMIGGDISVQVDVGLENLHEDDIFILCSDGMNSVAPDDFVKYICRHESCNKVADELTEAAIQRGAGKADNTTLVYICQNAGKHDLPAAVEEVIESTTRKLLEESRHVSCDLGKGVWSVAGPICVLVVVVFLVVAAAVYYFLSTGEEEAAGKSVKAGGNTSVVEKVLKKE